MLRKLFVLVLLTLTIGVPVAAQGAVVNIVDARGDVRREAADGSLVKADGEQRADILRTRIQHTDRALVVRTKLDRLRREGRQFRMVMRIRTNDGSRRLMELKAGRRIGWRGQSAIGNRRVLQCGISHTIDYANDVIAVRIPSSCLGNPRWVQATLVTLFLGGGTALLDNPHSSTMRLKGVWTSRIRRG